MSYRSQAPPRHLPRSAARVRHQHGHLVAVRERPCAADLLDMGVPEVKNRATITGAIEIGRAPGVVQVTFLAPAKALARRGLAELVRTHYGMET